MCVCVCAPRVDSLPLLVFALQFENMESITAAHRSVVVVPGGFDRVDLARKMTPAWSASGADPLQPPTKFRVEFVDTAAFEHARAALLERVQHCDKTVVEQRKRKLDETQRKGPAAGSPDEDTIMVTTRESVDALVAHCHKYCLYLYLCYDARLLASPICVTEIELRCDARDLLLTSSVSATPVLGTI